MSKKLIDEEIELKVYKATKNREKEEMALKNYKMNNIKLEKDSMKQYKKHLLDIEQIQKNKGKSRNSMHNSQRTC